MRFGLPHTSALTLAALAVLALFSCGDHHTMTAKVLQGAQGGLWLARETIQLYSDAPGDRPPARASAVVEEGRLFLVLGPGHGSVMKHVRVEGGMEGWIDTRAAMVARAKTEDVAARALTYQLQRAQPGERWALVEPCILLSRPSPSRPGEQDIENRVEALEGLQGAKMIGHGTFTVIGFKGSEMHVRFDDGSEGWIDGTDFALPQRAFDCLFGVK